MTAVQALDLGPAARFRTRKFGGSRVAEYRCAGCGAKCLHYIKRASTLSLVQRAERCAAAMSMMALDLGTRLGYAIRRGSGAIESGSADFSPESPSEHEGRRFMRFRAWLHDQKHRLDTAGEPIALIRYERVDFLVPGQVWAAHCWGGFWAHLCAWAEHHEIPCKGVATATLKKAATGSGRAPKPAIIAAMRARGFNPRSSDEADALALLFTSTMDAAA